MVVSKETLAKIKEIIEKNYNSLLISVAGNSIFTEEELRALENQGVDTSNEESLLEMIYYNYVLNDVRSQNSPNSISEMRKQQVSRPYGEAHEVAEEHINESFRHVTDKMRGDVSSRIEGIIRDGNLNYRNDALQNLNRPDHIDQLIKESTVGQLKQRLRGMSGDFSRNWDRISVTEVANSLGMGSADRIISQNKDKKAEDIYVYRIPVNDAALCRFCRKFYLDSDGSPKVYKFSTLLNNGSNYGKKAEDWLPVINSTHPNDRESGVLELRSGWKVGPGGSVEFIGQEKWQTYIKEKLSS